MMQLLGYITLLFDSIEVRYKLYRNPADHKFVFRPEATISFYPTYSVAKGNSAWLFEGNIPSAVKAQLAMHLEGSRKKQEPPLI
ncbi:MAG: hypothetical protein EOP50_21685 [Sphingobacteriales bacterium]|nr:MAG: hypothetical protein EOP50_21685 [Sphingobacteriales bacterium]